MKLTRFTMNSFPRRIPVLETALAVTLIALSAPGFAAKGGDPGPPVGGETSNNLSLPGIQTESSVVTDASWSPAGTPVLGTHYSYGCDKPEANGQFNYPNTSCVDNLDEPTTYYDAAACTAAGAPCEGYEVSRIYWQKVDVNEWSADDDGLLDEDPSTDDFAYVYFTDWGDALEAVSWSERSVIRVETQPYGSTIPEYAPEAGCTDDVLCKTGFQMWHVSGQGITEHWGARATDAAVSFNYDWPFQIIKSTKARLNLTKLVPDTAVCPQPGGNANEGPPELNFEWTGSSWIVRDGNGAASDTCQVYDEVYSTETSVGGKYVYGYNLRMGDVEIVDSCPGWEKTGYWRLTFYVPPVNGEWQDILFHDAEIPNVAPPAPANCAREFPISENCIPAVPEPEPELVAAVESEDEDPDADDRLYLPKFSDTTEYNLSYLDICIVAKDSGGGGGGDGGNGPGDGGNGPGGGGGPDDGGGGSGSGGRR